MHSHFSRRRMLAALAAGAASGAFAPGQLAHSQEGGDKTSADKKRAKWQAAIDKGLKWVAKTQSKRGHWTASNYPTAMTALAGVALTASGSTTVQGPYAKQIRNAVTYICDQSRKNGLIGDPTSDNRYTYGHGFSMLFLSQILGEEEDMERRETLIDVLTRAVDFCGKAQTSAGGWGYMSAKDGNDFDEGSTTITQVQGLRACRNAGIAVPKEVIERAKKYIISCKNADGGISYSSKNLGTSRPAITAAAIAALYDAGAFDDKLVPEMYAYAKKNLHGLTEGAGAFGHWHYTFLYYSQVVYRRGEEEWAPIPGPAVRQDRQRANPRRELDGQRGDDLHHVDESDDAPARPLAAADLSKITPRGFHAIRPLFPLLSLRPLRFIFLPSR